MTMLLTTLEQDLLLEIVGGSFASTKTNSNMS